MLTLLNYYSVIWTSVNSSVAPPPRAVSETKPNAAECDFTCWSFLIDWRSFDNKLITPCRPLFAVGGDETKEQKKVTPSKRSSTGKPPSPSPALVQSPDMNKRQRIMSPKEPTKSSSRPKSKTKSKRKSNRGDSDFEIDLEWDTEDESADGGVVIVSDDDEAIDISNTPKTVTSPKIKSTDSKKRARSVPASSTKKSGQLAALANNPEALAAVAAVDEAVKRLPNSEEALNFTLLSEASYGGRAPDEPAHLGEKLVPRGHPDCLTGKTFVISGVLDSLRREEASDFIKRHGGKVTGSVSSRTSFLVVGQHTGRSKYHTAKSHGVQLINEDGLFSLVQAAPAPVSAVVEALPTTALPTTVPVEAKRQVPNLKAEQPMKGTSNGQGQLWVEKWRPKTAAELVGNQTLIATLRHWLKDWERVHLHGGEPSPMPGARGKDPKGAAEMKKKAVLLSGSPGIGKTSSALIVTRELGYEPVEVNASDTRSKSDASVAKGIGGKLSNSIRELTTNAAVSYDQAGRRRRLCLIMDEVDGMSAGDRGGVADLIKTIAQSKVPIIAICNDKYSPKLRSLRNHCIELDFRKPTVQQISKRMMEIASAEGLTMNAATMEALVQSSYGGDIRLILGQLQMLRLRARSLSYDQVKSGNATFSKDLEMSPFEAARRLLDADAGASLSLADQIELVFQDSDLVPLLVQENYLNHRPRIASNEVQRLSVIAKAAEGFSAGDVANRSVRQRQNWSLMPFAAVMGTVNPATYCRGLRETFGLYPNEPNFPRFSAWLGQNSSAGKQKRLLGELHTRMLSSGVLECDRTALRLFYLPVLRRAVSRPLVEKGKEGIEEVLALMREYSIHRDDIEFITDVTKFKTKGAWADDPFKSVESTVKSAFTRAFNAQHIRAKTGFGLDEGKKKRGKRGGSGDGLDDELEDEVNGVEGQADPKGEEDEEEDDMDPAVLKRRLMGLRHAGMELVLKDGNAVATGRKGRGGRGGGRGRGNGRGRGAK